MASLFVFPLNALHAFKFSKKSEHLHQPFKQLDNHEDKVGADGVQMGASPNPSKGGGNVESQAYVCTPKRSVTTTLLHS